MNPIRKQFSKLASLPGIPNSKWFRFAQGTILFIAVYVTVAIGILPTQYALEEGQIAPETIYASRNVIDHTATSLARAQAEAEVEDVYLTDYSVADEVTDNVTGLMQYLLAIPWDEIEGAEDADEVDGEEVGEETEGTEGEEGVEVPETEDQLQALVEEMLRDYPEVGDEDTAWALLALPLEDIEQALELTTEQIAAHMQQGIKVDEVDESVQQITNTLYAQIDPLLLNVVGTSLDEHFTHNRFYSAVETEEARRRARDQVEEVRILKGAKIVDRGETVTEEHISQLDALGMLHTSVPYGYYIGLGVLLLAVYCLWGFYLYKLRPQVFSSPSHLWLVGVIILLTLWAAKLFGGMLFESGSPYLIPASMAALLITIIFDINMALFFGTTLSLIIAVMAGSELSVLITSLVGSIVGAYSVTQVNQRSDLTRAGLFISVANVVTIIGLILTGDGLVLTQDSLQRTLIALGMGAGSGVLASVFAIGLLPFFETAFGITTSVRLLELANPNQKPLKRLLLEAPGTYHHSILVGNLAEAAAEVVGADPVLARVGAYYHDIGKLTRPYFFIENQFQGSNPHDRIPPSLSSMILTAHVKGGIELANQYKLPDVLKQIIQQHHGDTLTGFFYHRAMSERSGKDQLLEDKFRYGGPRPQFKEAGIIMLADSVEAAVRSLAQPNQSRIQTMVSKIVQDKLADGQLDQCDLTLKDLNLISEAFVRVMTGIYHKRIAYPTEQDLAKLGS